MNRTDLSLVNVSEFIPEGPADVSAYANRIQGSTILKIAADIREMIRRGEDVLNLTVGDFRPDQFPIPQELADHIVEAYREGETNYPPVAGVRELRLSIVEQAERSFGLRYPMESVLVAGGARPLLYASFMAIVDPGDTVLYPVPSWNNHHYVNLSGAHGVPLPVTPEKNFHLDRSDIEPHLSKARLLCLNSPLNPTGTCISESALRELCEAIVEENERRKSSGERPCYLVYDQVYHSLTFGDTRHYTPVGVVPEIAPYAILIDAVSKGHSGTGIRVGWALAAEPLVRKMTSLAGHYGAWAPRPEQVGTSRFLNDSVAGQRYREEMLDRVDSRLTALDRSFREMRSGGLPVEHIEPQGAIYLSVRFDLVGKSFQGKRIESNEDIRALLLEQAGFAVIPFQAFGLDGNDGWMRVSVGAVSLDEIEHGLARVRGLLERTE